MKTFWILNRDRWEDSDSLHQDKQETEESYLPGELMHYSDVKISANCSTIINHGEVSSNSQDGHGVWREEDVFVGADQKAPQISAQGGLHKCV